MREITFDLTEDSYLPQSGFGGFEGEHNATRLTLLLPPRLVEEDAVYYMVFEITGDSEVVFSAPLPLIQGGVSAMLPRQVMTSPEIRVHAAAYRREGEELVEIAKSGRVILSIKDPQTGRETAYSDAGGEIPGLVIEEEILPGSRNPVSSDALYQKFLILQNYAEKSDLEEYAKRTELEPFATTQELLSALASYVTNAALSAALAPCATRNDLYNALSSYVTSSAFRSALNSYVTSAAFNSALSACYSSINDRIPKSAIGSGFGVRLENGYLATLSASPAQIDAGTNEYAVITPANLEYAVKKVGDGYYATEAALQRFAAPKIILTDADHQVQYQLELKLMSGKPVIEYEEV